MCRGICRTSVQAVDFIRPVGMELFQLQFQLGGSSEKQQEACPLACFWDSHGSLTMLGLSVGSFVGFS